jgi:hypothetical protein
LSTDSPRVSGPAADLSFLYDFVCECPNPNIAAAMRALVDYWLSHQTDVPKLDSLATLKERLSNEELIEVSWLLALNPNTPPSVLQDLCTYRAPRANRREQQNRPFDARESVIPSYRRNSDCNSRQFANAASFHNAAHPGRKSGCAIQHG